MISKAGIDGDEIPGFLANLVVVLPSSGSNAVTSLRRRDGVSLAVMPAVHLVRPPSGLSGGGQPQQNSRRMEISCGGGRTRGRLGVVLPLVSMGMGGVRLARQPRRSCPSHDTPRAVTVIGVVQWNHTPTMPRHRRCAVAESGFGRPTTHSMAGIIGADGTPTMDQPAPAILIRSASLRPGSGPFPSSADASVRRCRD